MIVVAGQCEIRAVKGRRVSRVHGEADSRYVQALRAAGWSVRVIPEADTVTDAGAGRDAGGAGSRVDADADGW